MKEFYVDFSGYCTIQAKDEEEAKEKFWENVTKMKSLPCRIFEIDGIEQKEE